MGVISIGEVSKRESLENTLLMCFPWDEEPSENYNALLDFYVQARAEEDDLAVGEIDQRYRNRVWKNVCKLADERERRFEEHPFGPIGEVMDYLFPPLARYWWRS